MNSNGKSSDVANDGVLYVAATPIGNLGDVSARLQSTLASVDVICAEDTRLCRRLLNHLAIHAHVISCHEHNETERVPEILARLRGGESVALVSDAGTPLISDPGYRLVSAAVDEGVRVVPIPGPSAMSTALSVSGLAVDRFVFEGFLPRKASARRQHLESLIDESRTLVFFESSHRVVATIADLAEVFGGHRIATVARELTKRFETIKRDSLAALSDWIRADSNQQRGEFVVLVSGHERVSEPAIDDMDRVLKPLLAALALREAVDLTVKISGAARNDVYQRALALRDAAG